MDEPESRAFPLSPPLSTRLQLYFRARYFEVNGKMSFDQGLRLAGEEALERWQAKPDSTGGEGQQPTDNEKP